jgi:hypothetical protein
MCRSFLARILHALFFLAVLCAAFPFFAERYVIANEELIINGRTKLQTVRRIIDDPQGREFDSREELQRFVDGRKKILDNTRQFERVDIAILDEPDALNSSAEESGKPVPITIAVTLTDSAPFAPIPFAVYNSNLGFMAGLFVNMPNFFGRFQNMMVITQYTAYPNSRDELQWANPNFTLGVIWNGIRAGDFSLGFTGFFGRNNDLTEIGSKEMIKTRAVTLSTSASVVYDFSGTVSNRAMMGISGAIEPEILEENNISYRAYNPIKTTLRFIDTLSYEKIDWQENYRAGINASVSAGARHFQPYNESPWSQFTASAQLAAFDIWGKVNPSARIFAEYAGTRPTLEMAHGVRGIRDAEFAAESALFFNTGLQIKLFRLKAMEIHINPLFDAALFFGNAESDKAVLPAMGIGLEVIMFHDRMKSMPIKLGIAYDLHPVNETESKRFEIDLNFTFTY